MAKAPSPAKTLERATIIAKELNQLLATLDDHTLNMLRGTSSGSAITGVGGKTLAEIERVLRLVSPQRYAAVGITLGRADGIAKFFAFSFLTPEKSPLASIDQNPFWGSGVYAIYYHGRDEPAYAPLSCSETPIYVGKADPGDAFADSIESQGQSLYKRLREHAKNISKTNLQLTDFHYRAATIQSGMQAAVEEFMLRLFRPIWNKSVGVCHGLGKHGDSSKTRANKRSPWDTMHPGRKWAHDTTHNQAERHEITDRIAKHFDKHPVISGKPQLLEKLSLR